MSDFKVVPWSADMDLTEFYQEAAARGFLNNSSQKTMIDCFSNEREKQVWILLFENKPIGSVAAHSFDDVMGEGSYRIAARTCVLTDNIKGRFSAYGNALRTISVITKHQNPTAQFLIPACIEWAGIDKKLYITSNESKVGTQRRVHNIFGPALQKQGIMCPVKETIYRGTLQTIWSFDPVKFYEQLNKFGRW